MKNIFCLLALMSASLPAFAREIVSLDCKSRPQAEDQLHLQVESMWGADDGSSGTLRDVRLSVTNRNDPRVQIGRTQTLNNDANYRPRRYLNTLRFDMSKLTNTENFGPFYPSNECRIQVMIRNDILRTNASRIEAPVVIGCEQSGGSQTMDCDVTTVR